MSKTVEKDYFGGIQKLFNKLLEARQLLSDGCQGNFTDVMKTKEHIRHLRT